MKIFLNGLAFQFLLTTFLFAEHNLYLFEQANKFYEQDQYKKAVQAYEEIIGNGYESWELYYNLGNAYYKNRQLGKAILNYERAIRLEPENEDVQFNLEIANLSVVDKINIPPEVFIFEILSDFKNYFSLNTFSIIVIAFYLLIITFVILRILIRNKKVQNISFVIIILGSVIFVVFASILGLRINDSQNIKYGVILVNKVDVMSSPDKDGTEVFSLHEGLKAQVQRQVNNWYQIRLSDGKVGWVMQDILEII